MRLVILIVFLHSFIYAQEQYSKQINKSEIKGGLCLNIGAKDTKFSENLIIQKPYYIQILQKDFKSFQEIGKALTNSPNKEKIGARNAKFDTAHYDSNLFNLILVADSSEVSQSSIGEIARILVPGGCLLIEKLPTQWSSDVKTFFEIITENENTLLVKKNTEIEWKPCDSIKWRAGSRAQFSCGWGGIYAGEGKFFYIQRNEIPGTLELSTAELVCRDAYNGSVLWRLEDSKEYNERDWRGWHEKPLLSSNGKVFTVIEEKLVCLDCNTGKKIYDIIATGLDQRQVLEMSLTKKYLIIFGSKGLIAYDINDGKEIWRFGGAINWTNDENSIYYQNREALFSVDINDPKKINWKNAEGDAAIAARLKIEDDHLILKRTGPNYKGPNLTRVDQKTGKFMWSYSNTYDGVKKRSLIFLPYNENYLSITYSAYETKEADLWIDTIDVESGKEVNKNISPKGADPFNMCAPIAHRVGKNYLVYFFNKWVDLKTNNSTFTYLSHPSCHFGNYYAYGNVYNVPSRKRGPLVGISAIAPASIQFNNEAGGKKVEKFSEPKIKDSASPNTDWPMFGGNMTRSFSVKSSLEKEVKLSWKYSTGAIKKSFGNMNAERTGLTQPVIFGDTVIVSDIDSQRIIAINKKTGKEIWATHIGSRIDHSPSLYKNLCVASAKDGWVYCLNMTDGSLVYKVLVPPVERLIGSQDKLESQWPMVSDVLIVDGIGYVSAGLSFSSLGGVRTLAFKVETGEVVWSKCYSEERFRNYSGAPFSGFFVGAKTANGIQIEMSSTVIDKATGELGKKQPYTELFLKADCLEDYLAGGISIPRNAEDRGGELISDGRIEGKTIAFDDKLSVAYLSEYGAETWSHKKGLPIFAKTIRGKEKTWEIPNNEMTVSSMLLTEKFVICDGYYQKTSKPSEVIILSRETGEKLSSITIEGLPSNMGMSVSGNQLFVTTKEGDLFCFQ